MSKYRIFETESFLSNIEQITKGGAPKIKDKLSTYVYPQLRKEPHYGPNIRKLKNWEPQTWRYRIRDWRFFYEIDEKEKNSLSYCSRSQKRSIQIKRCLFRRIAKYLPTNEQSHESRCQRGKEERNQAALPQLHL